MPNTGALGTDPKPGSIGQTFSHTPALPFGSNGSFLESSKSFPLDLSMCRVPLVRPLLALATRKLPHGLCPGYFPCRKWPAEKNKDKSLTRFLASGSMLPGMSSALAGCSIHSHTLRNLWRSRASMGYHPPTACTSDRSAT